MNRIATSAVLLMLAALAAPALAVAQPAAPVLQASVSGQAVSASWTPSPGATSYRVEAGASPSLWLAGYEMGAQTSFTVAAPQGVYYLRVRARDAAGLSAPSNVVSVTVQSAQAPPSAPTNFSASVAGTTVTLSAQLPPESLTGLLLVGGVTPGSSQGLLPLAVSAQNTLTNVPPGVYYTRLVAVNNGGQSPASNEVQIVVSAPTCGAPAVPVVNAQVAGVGVVVSWGAISGAVAYRVDVATSPGGAAVASQVVGPQTTAVSNPNAPAGTFYVKVTAASACGLTATSSEVPVTVVRGSNRTPNPPPGQQLPLPNRDSVVQEVARQYPGDLRNSCVSSGGNNVWLYRLVQRLRQEDTRWGLNWKRGRVGDMSQDVITYNWGSENDEGTRQIYVLDIIGGHCGPTPGPAWNNVTGVGGADAIWTLQPYLQAGFP